jgi:LysR substrate binding domain
VDLAILSLPARMPAGISLRPLTSEAMILVCAVGHGLAARRGIRLPELSDDQFIDHPRGWGARTSIDRSFSTAGVERQVAFEVGDTASVVNLVRHGLGVAFLPPSIVANSERVALVPVRGRSPPWEISLARPTNRPVSAAARAFADAAVPWRPPLVLAAANPSQAGFLTRSRRPVEIASGRGHPLGTADVYLPKGDAAPEFGCEAEGAGEADGGVGDVGTTTDPPL